MTEAERAKRFTTAYNRIDQYLRGELKRPPNEPLFELIRDFDHRRRDIALMHRMGPYFSLRNAIVHGQTRANVDLFIPTEIAVLDIEEIAKQLVDPPRVATKFTRKVETVSPETRLVDIWKIIKEKDFSQFPIYEGRNFLGLVTEAGISRLVTDNVMESGSFEDDISDLNVGDCLTMFPTEACCFIGRDTIISDVLPIFSELRRVEAVLITQNGRASEVPLGIITVTDIIDHLQNK